MLMSKAKGSTPAERLTQLEKRVERLQQEVAFLREKGVSAEESHDVLTQVSPVSRTRKGLWWLVAVMMGSLLGVLVGLFIMPYIYRAWHGKPASQESTPFLLP